ncbi:sulfatase-like hydrolase/transferase [Snuella lapsa]|uniref:Sulfatase N-terminal domain-containing protein n=1 Tax=Snuella lapsa TaxID=870481 RepID=A0ABP6XZJ4_9FLAO
MKLNYFLVPLIFLLLCNCKTKEKEENSSPSTPPIKPNVIVILADDLGYNDVGFNGSKDIKTPNIDQLANNGTIFTNGYVSYAVCGPSRAGLITGRYQGRFGFSRNPLFAPKDSLQGLPTSEETLADALGKSGYQNMAIGKWHLGAHESQRPLKRGFNEFFGFLTGGHKYFPEQWIRQDISEVTSQGDAYNTKLLRNNERVEENEYLTDALSREAVSFVERHAETPFFLYLAYNAPHTPLQATEKYLSRYPDIKDKKRKTYAAMVSAVDDGVGNLLNKLKELNIENNTIVFFLSDNGGPEQHGANNGELREGKGSLHEGGIRVPFAVQWTGTIPAGKVYNNPVISLDIFATAVALAGISPKNEVDGTNLIPYLKGQDKSVPHKHLFWRHFDAEAFSIRQGDIKLVKDKKGDIGLYNLANDISETNSIDNDSLRLDLKNKHDQWNSTNIDPVFLGLKHNKMYNQEHPNRFVNGEKY